MKRLLTLAVIFFVFTVSCKKDKLNPKPESSNLITSTKSKLTNSPNNVDGILWFNTEQHLHEYYATLNEIVENGHDNDLNVDSLLQEVEENLGFLSYRQDFINKYDWDEREFNDEEIDGMTKKDFIIDEVRKSILNEYMEVGIGDYLYVYYSENQVYKIPKTRLDVIEDFRTIEKGDDTNIPQGIIKNGVVLLSGRINFSQTGIVKDAVGEVMYINTTVDEFPCNTYDRKITTQLFRTYIDSNNTTVVDAPYTAHSITIDYGDNTADLFLNTSLKTITHTYPSLGDFDVTITIVYVDSDGVTNTKTDTKTITIGRACTEENYSESNSESNSDYKITYKAWVKFDIFGKHTGAYTHSFKWKASKSKWKRHKRDLYCRIEGNYGTSSCTIEESVAKSKTKNGKKLSSKKHKNFNYYGFGNGDCKSFHSFGGSSFYNTVILNPCD